VPRIGVELELVDREAHERLDAMSARFTQREACTDESLDSRMDRLADIGGERVSGRGRIIDGENLITDAAVIGGNVPVPAVAAVQRFSPADAGFDYRA